MPRYKHCPTFVRLGFAAFAVCASFGPAAHAKPFMDYIQKMPLVAPLSTATWGVAGVLPRDLSNGIESVKGAGVHPEYYYWDGQIIKAKDGKYHLFMSTFSGDTNFGTSWFNSDAYHAVSQNNVLGPYQRQGFIYDNNGSHKGHNVTALELPDGKYAVVVSETVPFTIYTSTSLDGPWTSCQPTSQVGSSNVSLWPRHDGRFQIVERNGTIAISDTLCGTYVKQTPTCTYPQNDKNAQGNPVTGSVYVKRSSIPNVPSPTHIWQEDPHIWRSGGVYHVIYSGSGDRVGWHVYSEDGITDWKDNGYAWSPREYQKIFCYEGSDTCNQWYKMERPGVVLENGHPTHITWAVADVDKDYEVLPGSKSGTKIIVVPFDGIAFDNDFGVDGPYGGAGGGGGMAGAAGDGGAAVSGGAAGGGGSPVEGGGAAGASGGTMTSAGVSGQATTGGAPGVGGAAGTAAVAGAAGSPVPNHGAVNVDGPDAGCGCRMAPAPAPAKWLAAFGLLGLFYGRRSKRRGQR